MQPGLITRGQRTISYFKTDLCTFAQKKSLLTWINLFYQQVKLQLFWEWNECLNIKIYKFVVSNLYNMSNCHPLEVVGRGSETQIQVGEKNIF